MAMAVCANEIKSRRGATTRDRILWGFGRVHVIYGNSRWRYLAIGAARAGLADVDGVAAAVARADRLEAVHTEAVRGSGRVGVGRPVHGTRVAGAARAPESGSARLVKVDGDDALAKVALG